MRNDRPVPTGGGEGAVGLRKSLKVLCQEESATVDKKRYITAASRAELGLTSEAPKASRRRKGDRE